MRTALLFLIFGSALFAQPTISSTGPITFANFNGAIGNQGTVYVDGMPLPTACGAGGTGVAGGWGLTSFNTTCFTNGNHQILMPTGIANLTDPYLQSVAFASVTGNNINAPSQYAANGNPVWFTGGSLPSPLVTGSAWYWTTSTTNPSNTVTVSIASGTMTFTTSASNGLTTNGTPVFVRNIQSTSQTTGLPNCDGYFTNTTYISATSFSIPAPSGCPNGAAANLNLEVIIYPYFAQYVDANTITVSATCGAMDQFGQCTPGSTVTLSGGGSGTLNQRLRSPYWTGYGVTGGVAGGDFITGGGQAYVNEVVNFQNGATPMQMTPLYWEMHLVAGGSSVNLCNPGTLIENTDLSFTNTACNASGITWTPVDDGGLAHASVATLTISSGSVLVNPVGAGWMQIQWSCSSAVCANTTQGTTYVQVHSGSVTFPHFSRQGPILTSFTPGQSFIPSGMLQMDVTFGTSYHPASVQQPWLSPMVQQAGITSATAGLGPGQGPGTTPQSSCPSWTSGQGFNYAETFASANNMSLEFDMANVFWNGNSGAAPITSLAAILNNTQYNRRACVTSLVTHQASSSVYWGMYADDEFTDELGTILQPNPTIGNTLTSIAVSGGTATLNFTYINVQTPWVQSTGIGDWIQIVNATNTCLNGWYPVNAVTPNPSGPYVAGEYTIAITSTSSCGNGTYEPSGGITETTAQFILNPSNLSASSGTTFNSQQNCQALPSALSDTQQGWTHTYYGLCGGATLGTVHATSSALSSIVVSGSTATINWTGHCLTGCANSPNAIPALRIGGSTNGLNIVAVPTVVDANTLTITYPGTTGQVAPSAGTYTSSNDANLFITLDPYTALSGGWGPNPLGTFYSLVRGVSGYPSIRHPMLGVYFRLTSIPALNSWQNINSDATFVYNANYPTLIYGTDMSVWGAMNYANIPGGNNGGGLQTRAYQVKPRMIYWGDGYIDSGNTISYCRSFLFNPACDRPASLGWRPEETVAQIMGMKTDGVSAFRAYNFTQGMPTYYTQFCCGWSSKGTGNGNGMNPANNPEQWAAMARTNILLALTTHTELQPEANKPYYGPFFSTDAHLSSTYGNSVTIVCGSESAYGQFPVSLNTFGGGSVIQYSLQAHSLQVTPVSGNPSTITQEWCASPGASWILVAQPAGYNALDTIAFAPPATLPFGASKYLIQVGYYPTAMQDDPVTDCTSACAIPIDHHNTSAWYRVIYADSNDIPRSIGDPLKIPSQGLN